MSRQVDKNIEELSTRLSNVLNIIDIKQVDFALECKINPGTLSKALERGSFSDDIVDKIHDRYGVRKRYWEDGKEPIIEKNGTYVETPMDNKESMKGEVYKTIVEGDTEYVLIPRSVLQDKYRLRSLEDIAKDEKVLDKLLDANEKMLARLLTIDPKFVGVEQSKEKAGGA